ncbi:MAG TPA: C39 family peptidase [Candidatus Saccharimonadia bacterium]|nr:C39 family peptidase [Candidatus Saccharimonadia bacterium]
MNGITHSVKHYYQPTNNSCSQAALAMLLSHYGQELSPEHIMESVPVGKNDQGEDWGTINQQLATWCRSQGYGVELHTADFQIIDLSWANLAQVKLIERMELAKDHRVVPALGKAWSQIYLQSYIDFVKAGGGLYIRPFMTTGLIDDLLVNGPLLVCICYSVLYNTGRSKNIGLRESKDDDLSGKVENHSVVIYGRDKHGNYLVADPWKEPGRHVIESERLLCAMTAAQIECDNLLFQVHRADH